MTATVAQVPDMLRQIVASIGKSSQYQHDESQAPLRNIFDDIEKLTGALNDSQSRIYKALNLLVLWGNCDGEDQKRWVIVQAIKALIDNEEQYETIADAMRGGLVVNEEGEFEHEHEWEEGIEPV